MIISSNADPVQNLSSVVGGSITFPEPVFELGYLIYETKIVATVTEGKTKILKESWKDKVLWNNATGFFTITKLQQKDSGNYVVDANKKS